MVISIDMQVKIVLFSFLGGLLTGVLFDLYRVLRGFNTIKIIIIIEDILFWILCSIVVFIFLLYTNYAFITPYVYLCLSLGILFYIRVISKVFLKVQYSMIKYISKTFRVLFKHIMYPFRILFYSKYKK